MDRAERDRLRKELDAQRHRVVLVREDRSRATLAKGISFSDAFSVLTKLILENGLSVAMEVDEPSAHVKALGLDSDAKFESN
jgi:hypothetical protein